jgi:DNA-binding PadR family transcriptional regulator
MKGISAVEFALLQILSGQDELSGYDVNRLVGQRGYREWTGIGSTSIYGGLAKLGKKGWAQSRIGTEKTGKGALPRLFRVTDEGLRVLKSETLAALAGADGRDGRFDLAIGSIETPGLAEVRDALQRRIDYLTGRRSGVVRKIESQGGAGLPVGARELFRHSFERLDMEIAFTRSLIDNMDAQAK